MSDQNCGWRVALFLHIIAIIIMCNLWITASNADIASVNHHKKKWRKNSPKRSLNEREEFAGSVKTDDLIRSDNSLSESGSSNLENDMVSGTGKVERNFLLSDKDRQKLGKIYGSEMVRQHEKDFIMAEQIGDEEGPHEHKIPWKSGEEPVTGIDKEISDEARLNAVNPDAVVDNDNRSGSEKIPPSENQSRSLDPKVVKHLLQELLERLDGYEENSVEKGTEAREQQPVITLNNGHCNIHGLWLSSVAGAAIELLPFEQDNHIEIDTKIFDLPENPDKAMITSQWTGKGMISSESPTTITITFQEHLENTSSNSELDASGNDSSGANVVLPKTAVFVGQCLVCDKSPVLQGTWVIFPNSQNCLPGATGGTILKAPPSTDTFYRLQR